MGENDMGICLIQLFRIVFWYFQPHPISCVTSSAVRNPPRKMEVSIWFQWENHGKFHYKWRFVAEHQTTIAGGFSSYV